MRELFTTVHSSLVRSDNEIGKFFMEFPRPKTKIYFFSSYRTNPANFDKFPFDLMIFYNFHIMPSMVIGMISGRITIKFKKDIKEFFIK